MTDDRDAAGPTDGGRPTALVLAGLHLRTGALALARVELEAAAGDQQLDDAAIVDLAEARWRTGDTVGAGQAAAAHLGSGGDDLVALVIAAEAAAIARGGSSDAEALVARAVEKRPPPMSDIVAGMPLGAPWPGAMDAAAPQTEPLRDLGGLVDSGAPGRVVAPLVPIGTGRAIARAVGGPVPSSAETATAADPQAAFAAGADALAAGDREAAALHLGVALRLSPALAPAILSAVGGTPGPAFDMLRGDAFRLVGHESDARRAYAAVGRSLATRDEDPDPRGEVAPAEPATPAPPGRDPTGPAVPFDPAPQEDPP